VSARPDTVINKDSILMYKGTTENTVSWLEKVGLVYIEEPLWVSIGETGDIMSASQYLDLAT
jgi:hypothetical protein